MEDQPREGTPEQAPAAPEEAPQKAVRQELVHLPTLISNEFGIAASQARMEIALGHVEVDGERIEGDKMDLPIDKIDGKEIVVVGKTHHFKLTYPSPTGDFR